MRLQWTLRARGDLVQIRDYVEQDSPSAARLVLRRIVTAAQRLIDFPESGRRLPELPQAELREVIQPPYRIVYRVVRNAEIQILTVHHSARRLPELN